MKEYFLTEEQYCDNSFVTNKASSQNGNQPHGISKKIKSAKNRQYFGEENR
ncbi:hypothetical protein ACQKMV_07115 [Lysinibacillus sp. NPDC094403]|uniref:hypothetical protein n=1 Tax=Lysinibacillus sp. NPDC094403 TaxID=3390581 RepID=UPI003D04C2ED